MRSNHITFSMGFLSHTRANCVLVMGLPEGSVTSLKLTMRFHRKKDMWTAPVDDKLCYIFTASEESVLVRKLGKSFLKYFDPKMPDEKSYQTNVLNETDILNIHRIVSKAVEDVGMTIAPDSEQAALTAFMAEKSYGEKFRRDKSTSLNHYTTALLPFTRAAAATVKDFDL